MSGTPARRSIPIRRQEGRKDDRSDSHRDERPVRRVRVASPRMAAAARPPARPPTRDLDEQTVLGEVYLRSLLRAQLRLGLSLLGVVVVLLAACPALFALVPGLAGVRLFGIRLPWLVFGFGVHPVLIAAGWWYVRLAERAERDFTDLLARR